ncbi:MAG: hypothetical protein LUF28_01775 [Clostridiales bacterium]|nr:hypothetical protein [Clostridiales bacterium]
MAATLGGFFLRIPAGAAAVCPVRKKQAKNWKKRRKNKQKFGQNAAGMRKSSKLMK